MMGNSKIELLLGINEGIYLFQAVVDGKPVHARYMISF